MGVLTYLFRLLDSYLFYWILPAIGLSCVFLDNIGKSVPLMLQEFQSLPMVTTFTSNVNALSPYILTLCLMIVLASVIINMKFDAVKHVVNRTISVALMALLIPVIITQGINLAVTVSNNISGLVGNNSLYTTLINTVFYENPEWESLDASKCTGENEAIGNISNPLYGWFGGPENLFAGFVPKGSAASGKDNNYVQGVKMMFFPSINSTHQSWKNAGLDPTDNKTVFPNDNGDPFPKDGTKGLATTDSTIKQIGLRYMNTACVLEGGELVMKWEVINPLALIALSICITIIAIMVFMKLIESVYEAVMLGIFLPLTNLFRISETGAGVFKAHLTQFCLALAEIPTTIVVAWMGISFLTLCLVNIDTWVKQLFPTTQELMAAGDMSIEIPGVVSTGLASPVLMILFMILAIRIMAKGPQRLSKVFESNFGISSTGSQMIGQGIQMGIQYAMMAATRGQGGGPSKPTPSGGPEREGASIPTDNSPINDGPSGGGASSYANASRDTSTVDGIESSGGSTGTDIPPTSDANQTQHRSTTVVNDINSVGSQTDSPYSGMSSQQRTTYVNNNVVNQSSGQLHNPDDYNGTR